ncbi:putative IS5 family transposase IS1515 [Hollandina sp. SP2]
MNIIDIREAKGSEHDFKVYKDTIGKSVHERIRIDADLGYLGIEKLHKNSRIPKKTSKRHKLTKREKAYNKQLARERVVIEHVNAKIKTFKIMAYPYRNHCKRHLLRMSLICGIINFELHI